MADVYFADVAADYWAVMAAVAEVVAGATPVVISVWMDLEKAVTILSTFLGFRVSVSLSSLSTALFFDPRVDILLVLRRL